MMNNSDNHSEPSSDLQELEIASIFKEETGKVYPRGARKPSLDDYDGTGE